MSDVNPKENQTQPRSGVENSTTNVCVLTAEELKYSLTVLYKEIDILTIGLPAWVYVLLVAIGIICNFFNIVVFTRPAMKSSTNFLLTWLEAVNIVVFATFIPDIVFAYWPEFCYSYVGAKIESLNICITTCALFSSNWTTVVVSVWRLIAVMRPLISRDWCSKRVAVFVVTGLLLLSMTIGFVFYFVNHVADLTCYVYEAQQLTTVIFFKVTSASNVTTPIGQFIILLCTTAPCLTLSVMTTLLIFSLWKAKRRRNTLVFTDFSQSQRKRLQAQDSLTGSRNQEERITITLIIILLLMIVAYIPDTVVNISRLCYFKDKTTTYSFWFKFWKDIAHSRFGMLCCNCVTFLVYFVMSARFRSTFFDTFPLFNRMCKCDCQI